MMNNKITGDWSDDSWNTEGPKILVYSWWWGGDDLELCVAPPPHPPLPPLPSHHIGRCRILVSSSVVLHQRSEIDTKLGAGVGLTETAWFTGNRHHRWSEGRRVTLLTD